jgi:hypothetical protein
MSSENLIRDLSADLAPVRRRSVLREWSLVLGLGVLELALVLSTGLMRPDMGMAIGHPYLWWKLGSLALIVAASIVTAIRSFAPTVAPRRGLMLATGLAGLAAIAGILTNAGLPTGETLTMRLYPAHGLVCALCIVVLSLPLAGLLSIFMRRAAPTHPEGSAIAVGLASGSWGAFVFAFCCPMNDPLYVAVWYAMACATVTGTARVVLPRGYRL